MVVVECILCPLSPSVPLPPPAPFKQIMEDFLFEKLWLMLYEHGASAKKKEGTRRYWSTLSSEQQQHVLITISRKLEEGRFVQFDPIRAIKENSRKYQLPEPINYNGNSLIDNVAKTTLLVSARHNGHAGIYTLADAIEHGMIICYGFNFDYEQYLKKQNTE